MVSQICIFGNTKKLQDLEEDEESLYSSQLQTPQREPRLRQVRELKIQYGQQCEGGSEVHIKVSGETALPIYEITTI